MFAMSRTTTRKQVAELFARGYRQSRIAAELGISEPTVSYHARKLGRPPDQRFARRLDWGAIQQHYDLGHSLEECRQRFGFSRHGWHAAQLRGDLVVRPAMAPLPTLLAADSPPTRRRNLKRRLIGAGLKANACEICGLAQWRGAPLAMALHHRNGDPRDNRLDNLELLCPNCHSQTDTFAGRNRRAAPAIVRPARPG